MSEGSGERHPSEDRVKPCLNEDDTDLIRRVFALEVVPKLQRHHARLGTIGCEFAGPQYTKWVLHFQSRGSGFEITGFEYDESAAGLDLDL